MIDKSIWQDAGDLLLQVLELPPAERCDFLDQACQGRPALLAEVQSLLDADERALQWVEQPVFEILAASPIDFSPGDRIGSYRVEKELGRGGMGAVYLATRADGEYQSRVAVKVLKRGMDSDEIVRRFYTERQILANLKHPNIAELYDGGTTADHRPYLVMEYIDGINITDFCDRSEIGIDQRLRIFLKVCSAVQLAHRNLVVHRDLKPGNILVDTVGEPKLLDFGIAKLLEPSGDRQTTATGLRPMTPHYASPEQARGETVTTATDIYSLGVLLYELLTGRHPYPLRGGEADRVRLICETPPRPLDQMVRQPLSGKTAAPKPGSAPDQVAGQRGLSPARLARRLAGDLDAIVRKALRKMPEHRYPSVEALAEDLRCHLEGRPVKARRPTLLYTAAKLWQRRKRELVVSALGALLLITFLADRHRQQQRTAREKDRAVQIAAFLGDLFSVQDLREAQGVDLTLLKVLDHGAARIEQEFAGQPDLQAELLIKISDGYHALGLSEPNLSLRQKATALIRHLKGPKHPDLAIMLERLAAAFSSAGRFEEAEKYNREALEIINSTLGENSQESILSTNNLAMYFYDQGRYREAEPILRQALARMQDEYGAQHALTAVLLGNLGMLQSMIGDYEAAESSLQRALVTSARTRGKESSTANSQRYHLAMVYLFQERFAEAEVLLLEVKETYERLLGEHPAVTSPLHALANIRLEQGRLAEASHYGQEALQLRLKFRGGDHPTYADSLVVLAEIQLSQGKIGEAEAGVREALVVYEQALPSENWRQAHGRAVLAGCLAASGKTLEARRILKAAIEKLNEQRGRHSLATRRASRRLEALVADRAMVGRAG